MPCQVPSRSRPCCTGTCSEVAVSMVLICAGMSSGPSVSWRQPAFSGASRFSAVVKSTSTVGSAFSWIVSDAEVWRMNSVTAPSRARASRTNFATSEVRSVKPAPEVCTVSNEDTMLLAATVDGVVRESDLGAVMKAIFVGWAVAPFAPCPPVLAPSRRARFALPTLQTRRLSNPAVDVPLHAIGHLHQTPPGPLQERHHAIHVAVARQRDFDLALAVGHLRLARLQRVRFRQWLFDLAGDRRLALGELGLEPFIVGLQPDNVGLQTAD